MKNADDRTGRSGESAFAGLDDDEALALDRACDRFEREWNAGAGPSIEETLATLPEKLRAIAVRELVAVEIERRRAAGEAVDAASYRARFPELNESWLSERLQATRHDAVESPTIPGEPKGDENAQRSDAVDVIGQVVGDYRILEKLGAGGMGTVYKAIHLHMGRVVALKALHARWQAQENLARRFEREVHAAARLSHPNVVVAYDAREHAGRRWLVTEFLEGTDLQRLVRRNGPLPADVAAEYVLQAARGLEYAHAAGLVHRDVKPSNLFLLDSGTVKVLDLGLSRFVMVDERDVSVAGDSDEPLTGSGVFLGTASYIAPEQARDSRRADRRADIYSLGCTLYYLLAGLPPFGGETTLDMLLAHVVDPPPSLPALDLPADRLTELQSIFSRMTARKADDRFASMSDVIVALETFLAKSPAKSHTATPTTRGVQSTSLTSGTSRATLVAVAAGILTACAIAWGVYAWNVGSSGDVPGVVESGDRSALAFNGTTSYVEVVDFPFSPDQPSTVEAVARLSEVRNGNLVSWLGTDWIALYVSGDGRWGVAKRVDDESYLLQSVEIAATDRFVHIAGVWDGETLRLFIDGVEARNQRVEYPLADATSGLYLGGLPSGRVPDDPTDRSFAGMIEAVRILRGARLPLASDLDPQNWTVDESTLALLRPDPDSGEILRDEAAPDRVVASVDVETVDLGALQASAP